MQKGFDVLKKVLNPLEFSHRVAYKMNEYYNNIDIVPIDIREVLAIIGMFSQTMYLYKNSDRTLNDQ